MSVCKWQPCNYERVCPHTWTQIQKKALKPSEKWPPSISAVFRLLSPPAYFPFGSTTSISGGIQIHASELPGWGNGLYLRIYLKHSVRLEMDRMLLQFLVNSACSAKKDFASIKRERYSDHGRDRSYFIAHLCLLAPALSCYNSLHNKQ